MGNWFDDLSSNFMKLPLGADVMFKIEKVVKREDKHDFDPKKKDGTPQGFHFELHTDKGVLTVGSYSLQGALVKAQAKEGDTINIFHPKKGEYIVKLSPF